MGRVALVMHDVRSAYNVGSLLRTAEGLGVSEVYLTGYTPYPEAPDDQRLPHQRQKQALQIHKSALGAEFFVKWSHIADIDDCIKRLKKDGYELLALEQTSKALPLSRSEPAASVALVVGNEISGLEPSVLRKIKRHVQIPMSGRKESFNVAIAAALAIYHLKHLDKNNARV